MILKSGVTHSEWNDFLKRVSTRGTTGAVKEHSTLLVCTSQKGGGREDRTLTKGRAAAAAATSASAAAKQKHKWKHVASDSNSVETLTK